MRRLNLMLVVIAFCAACGGGEAKQDEVVVEQPAETVETPEPQAPTVEPMTLEAPPTGTIPAPPNVAAAPDFATTTDSGIAYVVLEEGDGGESPTLQSEVTAHYTGWTTDGQMFDSSVARGEPFTAPLDKLIVGWQQGISMMTRGEKRRLWIPESLAYQGRPGAPQGMLVFDVYLIDFKPPAQ